MDSPVSFPYGPTQLTVLGTGAVDSPPSIYITYGGSGILFNVGEGTQRLCMDARIRVKRFSHIALSSLSWNNTGGLPGMLLTLADNGLTSISLTGPPGTGHFFDATRYFVQRNDLDIHLAELSPSSSPSSPSSSSSSSSNLGTPVKVSPRSEDTFLPALLYGYPIPHASSTSPLPPTLRTSIRAASTLSAAQRKRKQNRKTAESKRAKLLDDTTSSSSSSRPPTMEEMAEKYKEPKEPYPIDDQIVQDILDDPSRRFFPPFDAEPRIPYTPLAMAYAVVYPPMVGKFNPKAARQLGVVPGPLFKTLQTGTPVQASDGSTVHPHQVMGDPTPGATIMVLHCPDEAYLDALVAQEALRDHAAGPGTLTTVVHFTPIHIFASQPYSGLTRGLTELACQGPNPVQHIIVDPSVAVQRYLFTSASHSALKLHTIAPSIFPKPYRAGSPPQAAQTQMDALEMEHCHIGQVLDTVTLTPAKKRGSYLLANHPEPSAEDAAALAAATLEGMDSVDTATPDPEAVARISPDCPLTLLFLGTGAALPSKYRNVSGTLVTRSPSDGGGFILDFGEGSYGQLCRTLGPEGARQTIASLAFVFISHMHADHHLGLITALTVRAQTGSPPLLVIGPPALHRWLQELSCVHPLEYTFVDSAHLQPSRKDRIPETTQAALSALAEASGIDDIVAVPVDHCYRSYGAVISSSSQSWSVVFSGDCRPSSSLAAHGTGATVLIHEATFEEGLGDEAVAKKHATTNEAAQVGTEMGASSVFLNHFSQRYPKIPDMDLGLATNHTGIAFDYMIVRPSQAPVVASLLPWLRALLTPVGEEEEEAGSE